MCVCVRTETLRWAAGDVSFIQGFPCLPAHHHHRELTVLHRKQSLGEGKEIHFTVHCVLEMFVVLATQCLGV